MHMANHPGAKHFCEDIWQVAPLVATGGRAVGLAWFSPDCKHFSKAKGGRPVEKKIRGLAWVVIRWAKAYRRASSCWRTSRNFRTGARCSMTARRARFAKASPSGVGKKS